MSKKGLDARDIRLAALKLLSAATFEPAPPIEPPPQFIPVLMSGGDIRDLSVACGISPGVTLGWLAQLSRPRA